MQWLLCALTWIRGRSNATIMVVNVTMKREMSFICPQDFKNPGGILFHFREGPFRKCFPLCGICWQSSWHDCNLYGYSWRIRRRILRTDDGGKPSRLAASLALLVPEAASDAIASISAAMQGARASFKHGRPARARSSSFLKTFNKL
ncbi:hypothetical protein TNCV_2057961 [Trichonephila clavipes]|nr:hypothetical protein TNCV_2057961 [Trichonephila clavipes]